MKKRVKAILHKYGLGAAAERFYFNIRTATPSVIKRHVRFRSRGGPDGYPFPPSRLIYAIIGCNWTSVYWDSGQTIVANMADILEATGFPLPGRKRILDFGCGSGRLIRHVHTRTPAALFGTDYNAELIDWCSEALPFATFTSNNLEPPLGHPNSQFDYVYARSVFTHLPLETTRRWIRELGRVIEPGGILYLTMHGQGMLGGLTRSQVADFNAGELVVTYGTVAGQNLCSTYANRQLVEREFGSLFDVVEFVPGAADGHLRQDIYLLKRRTSD